MEIKEIFKFAVAKNSSDIHLCVGEPPVLRSRGGLERLEGEPLTHQQISEMLSSLFPEPRTFASGEEIDMAIEVPNMARFRLNIYHDKKGLCAAFRLIDSYIKPIEELGLPEIVRSIATMKRGLVLVTGITGSGKSTTLAAIIDLINSKRDDHIITIEDPIEFVYGNKKSIINQREVGVHTPSFSRALRAAVREDPDVILVGEMRDLETISMAMTAAEIGHLVLGTLHTRGAAQTIDRIIDAFPHEQQEQIRIQLAEAIEMIVSQVLVPSIDGKKRYLGCEVLVATTGIRQLIRNKKTHLITNEIETGAEKHMQTLDKSLKSLVNAGRISKQAALAWVHNKTMFERL